MAVRREKVVLELEDHLSTGMVKAAAATALLDKSLTDLDGSTIGVSASTEKAAKSTKEYGLEAAIADEKAARLKKTLRDQARASLDAEDGIGGLRRETDRADHSINQLTGRLRLFADAAAILGPSLIPVSAVAVPAITGLASQLGFAALGMGSLVTASVGVGDALKAVNEAALEPTAANLEKARVAMEKLGPEAQAFVSRFQELRPVLRDIRDQAAAGWFPGLTEALDHLEDVAPRVGDIFEAIGTTGGALVAEGAAALAGPEWAEFLTFIETTAPKALDDLGRTIGNVISGLADLWMAFDPLNDDFSTWLLDASRSFREWADGLSETQGFADFVEYIRTNGPRVANTLMAVADAVLQIIEALAPLGGPSLKIIELFAKAIAAIADSDLGTPLLAGIGALALYNRTLAVTVALQTKLGMTGAGGGLTKGLAGLGPWTAAAGAAAIVLQDIAAANNAVTDSIARGDLVQSQANLSSFKDKVDMDPRKKGFGEAFVSSLPGGQLLTDGAGIKNEIEGWFGKSDVEEAEAGIASLGDELATTASAANSVDVAMAELAEDEATNAWAKETAAAFSSLAADIEKPTLSLKTLNQRMRDNARAELNMGDNIRGALANGANPEAIKQAYEELGPSAALAFEELAKGGEDAATRFNKAFGKSTKASEVLEGALADLDQAARNLHDPTFNFDPKRALADIDRIIASLKSIPRSIRTDFYVNAVNGANIQAQGGRDGDPKTAYADGGLVRGPGGPRDDLVPIRASNMEYVVNADAVQHYGVDFFNAANAKRLGDGAVQSVRVPSQMGGAAGLSSADIDRIVSGLASVRPMYGDVKIQPHNYSEFTRQMDNDRRAMAAGGFGK